MTSNTTIDESIDYMSAPSLQDISIITRFKKVSNIQDLKAILGDASRNIIVIEFFAEWCGACKLIANKLEAWTHMYDVTVLQINVEELEDVAMEYNVSIIPNFVILKDRQILEQIEGSREDKIITALEKYCQKFDNGAHITKSSSVSTISGAIV